jgi:RNA polymerase sigma-70 factor (ECF subfamily)
MRGHARSLTAEELLEHASFLKHLARELVGDEHRAADLVQEAYAAALERPPRNNCSLRGWLAIVVANLARNALRGATRRARREELAARSERIEPDELSLERLENQRALFELVLALPQEQRTVLYLRYYEGLMPSAIAGRLGLPAKTVKTRHTRALAELRARLDARSKGDRAAWVSALVPLVRSGVPLAGGALVGIAGGVAMKQLVLGIGLVVVALLFWQRARGSEERAGVEAARAADVAIPVSSTPPVAPLAAEAPTVARSTESQRQALAPPATTGTLIVRLSWSDGTPAAFVGLEARCQNDPAPREETFPVITDATGSARIDGLFEGPVALELDLGANFPAAVEAGSTTTVELTIPEGTDVDGIVVAPDGRPVADAEVFGENAYRGWPSAKRLARTASDGTFRLRALGADARLGARATGYLPSAFTFEVAHREPAVSGAHTLTLTLGGPGGRIRGRVLDPEGRPLEGALVLGGPRGGDFVEAFDGGLTPEPVPVATDLDGAFMLPGDVEPGRHPIFAVARGYPIWEGSVEVVEDRSAFVEIRLELPAAIEGCVVTAERQPVAGIEVVAAHEERGGWYYHVFPPPRAISDADGRFRLDWVAPGLREVNAGDRERPRLGKAQRMVECASGATSACELVLDPGRTISGHVVDSAGRALEGWRVRARARSAGFPVPRDDRTDAQGAFLLTNLAEGAHELLVIAPGESPMTPRARVNARADSEHVRLVVEHAGTEQGIFRGIFLDAQGRVPQDARLIVRREGGMTFQHVEFDPVSGSFSGQVTAGRYRLMALRGRSSFGRSAPFEVFEEGEVDVGAFVIETPGRLEVSLTGLPAADLARLTFQLCRAEGTPESVDLVDGVLRSQDLEPGKWVVGVSEAELFVRDGEVEVRPGQTTRVERAVERAFPIVLAFRDPAPRRVELEARDGSGSRLVLAQSRLDEQGHLCVLLPAGRATIQVRSEDGLQGQVTLDVGPASAAPIAVELR